MNSNLSNLCVHYRSGEQGLNSSQSSGGTLVNTPPRGPPHRFGTQDAIARLYSSPSGTRRQGHAGNQQRNEAANQNLQYNRTYGQVNQNTAWSQNVPERSHPGKTQLVPSYDSNSNVVKTVTANNTMNSLSQTSVPYRRDQQRMHPASENKNVYSPQRQNGMVPHSSSHGSQFPSNRTFYTQQENVSGNPVENRTSYNSSNTSSGSFAMKSFPYNQNKQGLTGSDHNSYSQKTTYDQSDSQNFNNQSNFEGRLGIQPSWQYIGNGRIPSSFRPETTPHGQRVIYYLFYIIGSDNYKVTVLLANS